MQNHYSLVYREEEREMNAYCKFAGIGLIPWGPLGAGKLARPYTQTQQDATTRVVADKKMPWYQPDKDYEGEIIGRVEKLAKEKGWSMAQVALAWANSKVTSPIVGFSSAKRLEEAIIPGKTLTEEETKFLEEPSVLFLIMRTPLAHRLTGISLKMSKDTHDCKIATYVESHFLLWKRLSVMGGAEY
jgi:aryl-alcohol dehydrogenase-like predicted oxidoreductase